MTGSVGELWAEGISAGLAAKLPKQGKPQRRKLATMVATMGRAKMLGQRAIGPADPGALSVSFMFEGMANALAGPGR